MIRKLLALLQPHYCKLKSALWHGLFILILSCFTLSTTAIAANESLIERISHKIASIKNLISRDTNKRKKLQAHLASSEINSSEITKRLNATTKELALHETLVNNLKSSEQQYQAKLEKQESLLSYQIKTAYMLGRQPFLKLLLNQENSSEVSRILMYYHYLNQSRLQVIADIQNTLIQIRANQNKIKIEYQHLKILQQQHKAEQTQLTLAQENRKHLLSILNQHIQSRRQRLDELILNKRQLQKTIERVSQRPVSFPDANFSQLYKRLDWPTHGRLLPIYGTKIEQSELRWGGVLIKAPEGQPVYAIAKGKVVFAKWLSGYGLLLIINHGNGYMTLYGRNHLLYRNVGDVVHRGDLISVVGKTGGYQSPALYFAVRHNGESINPALFIRKESQ